MCGSTWGVSRRIKIGGKWKDRPIKAVEKDLEAAVCNAAARWKPQSGAEDSAGASEHIDAGGVSLEDAIEKLRNHKEADELASKILAAAIALRYSTGRDRQAALH